MSGLWSFYSLDTGRIAGAAYGGPEDLLALNTPPGHAPIPGLHDSLSRRVDLDTGEVVDWQPPAPADTELATHHWDSDIRRWVATPTVEALRRQQWASIKAERDRRETSGTFTALGSIFQSDPLRIGGAANGASVALAAGVPFQLVWTLADNTSRALGASEVVQVGMAQLAYIDGLHATARQLRQALAEARTPEEVAAVTWPAP